MCMQLLKYDIFRPEIDQRIVKTISGQIVAIEIKYETYMLHMPNNRM